MIFVLLFQAFSLTVAFDFSCPTQAHWSLRAKSMCISQRNYSCLFDVNLQVNVYRDKCIRPRIVGPGILFRYLQSLIRKQLYISIRIKCHVKIYNIQYFNIINPFKCNINP